MSRSSYKELRARVPSYPLSPLKEIREKQEILFGLTTPPASALEPALSYEPDPELSLSLKPSLPLEPEETDTFSTPKSVFTLVETTELPVEDDLALPPPAAITIPAEEDLIEINTLDAQLAENNAILKTQYATIEYYQTQLEYYANAINDYSIIYNYNKSMVDAQIKKLGDLSEQIMAKQEQLNSLNAQINAAMTAQLLTTFMVPPPTMAYT